MTTVELIVFCVLFTPVIVAVIWASVKETQANCRMRISAAQSAEILTSYYRAANCIIREKYEKIISEKEKNYES